MYLSRHAESVTLKIRTDSNAFLIQISTRYLIVDSFCTATHRQIIVLHQSIAKYLILPVGTLTQSFRVTESIFYVTICKSTQFITMTCILTQVHHINLLRYLLISHRSLKTNFRSASHSCFHCNQYDTIGGLRTINCSSRSIFQNLNTFNIGRVDTRNRITCIGTRLTGNNHPVYYINRLVSTIQRVYTTNLNRSSPTWDTGVLCHLQSCRTSLQCLVNGRRH